MAETARICTKTKQMPVLQENMAADAASQ